MTDIKVPTVGESISEVTLLKWVKNNGDYVNRDEVIAELESEKATFEVNAEKAGVLQTNAKEGDTLKIGDLLATIDESAAKPTNGKPADDAVVDALEVHLQVRCGAHVERFFLHPEPGSAAILAVQFFQLL